MIYKTYIYINKNGNRQERWSALCSDYVFSVLPVPQGAVLLRTVTRNTRVYVRSFDSFPVSAAFTVLRSSPCFSCVRWSLSFFERIDVYIYISSMLLAFGLSNSLIYGALASCINAFFVFRVWGKSFSVYEPPVNSVAISVLLYIFGLLVNRRTGDFCASVLIGLGAYVCTFFDTLGYALMHVMCGFLQQTFLRHLLKGRSGTL